MGKFRILVEIVMIKSRDYLVNHRPIQPIEINASTGRGRDRALHSHQHDIVMAVPIGIIALPICS
jgi:hypothetical protein